MFVAHEERNDVYPPHAETTMNDGERLRDRLAEVCKARGWTEREWAQRSGVSHSSLSAFRRRLSTDPNATMNRSILRALADGAHVKLAWLARGEGERDVPDDAWPQGEPREAETTEPGTLLLRVEEICREHGWTEKEWCERAGLNASTLSKLRERATDGPHAKMQKTSLRALASAAGVNERWLRLGDGERDAPQRPYAAQPQAAPKGVADVAIKVRAGEVPELVHGALVRWAEIEAEARAMRPLHPAWVWERVARVPLFLRVEPTADIVAALSDVVRWAEDRVERAVTQPAPAATPAPSNDTTTK